MASLINNKGVNDLERNPFHRESWIEQGIDITPKRHYQIGILFCQSPENILINKPEKRQQVYCIHYCRWSFAHIKKKAYLY
jgi:hypothetical protein